MNDHYKRIKRALHDSEKRPAVPFRWDRDGRIGKMSNSSSYGVLFCCTEFIYYFCSIVWHHGGQFRISKRVDTGGRLPVTDIPDCFRKDESCPESYRILGDFEGLVDYVHKAAQDCSYVALYVADHGHFVIYTPSMSCSDVPGVELLQYTDLMHTALEIYAPYIDLFNTGDGNE